MAIKYVYDNVLHLERQPSVAVESGDGMRDALSAMLSKIRDTTADSDGENDDSDDWSD